MGILSKIFGKVETKVIAVEQPIATTSSKKLRKRKPPRRLTEAERTEAIGSLKETVRRNGYRVISVGKLIQAFGYQKRSTDNINQIMAWLAAQHLTVHPELSLHLKPADSVRVYGFPVVQLGDLFTAILSPEEALTKPKSLRQQRERELEDYIKQHEHYRQLGLQDPTRQHSPQHTRDRFDFLCKDCDGNPVVLELKHRGGGKAAVEQVLRYMGMLKQANPGQSVNGILVTGIRDVDTAKALHGMTPEQQRCIKWYLYRFSKASNSLSFELVEYDFIAEHLHLAHNI